MKWDPTAEDAVAKVPFFIRKKVKRRVEEEARQTGVDIVTLGHVQACRQRFLTRMEEEVKGYEVETCFGANGCPNRATTNDNLAGRLENMLASRELKTFLKQRVKGPLKFHHEFRVSVSDCPNACSRPQIVDVGLIGARRPGVSPEQACSRCGVCVDVCREKALHLPPDGGAPVMDSDKCLACGQCLDVCPTGTLVEQERGYRVLVGGRLGRHPRLGTELEGLVPPERVPEVVAACVQAYMTNSRHGERLGDILERDGEDVILKAFPSKKSRA